MGNNYTKRQYTGYTTSSLKALYNKVFTSSRMRLLFSIAALFVSAMLWSQAPNRFSHQSVIRDLSNNLITDQALGVQITILQGAPNGTNVYRELYALNTNAVGLLSLEIGSGTVQNGSISAINWEAGPYFLEQAIDPLGGTNYTISRTTQLLSVPYALFAQSAGRANSAALADEATTILNASQFEAPIGSITPYSGPASSIPTGWLLCDGTAYDANFYSELFAVIGSNHGTAPSGQFRVPDLRGRTPMGKDAGQTEFASLGNFDGEIEHILTVSEMPAHNHGGATASAGSHSHQYGTRTFLFNVDGAGEVTAPGADGSFDNDNIQRTRYAGTHTHPIPSQGEDAAHNNLQPYATVNFIIKAN